MQFVITAYDGTDPQALERRLAVREAHLRLGDELIAQGHLRMAAAILDASEKMIGSTLIVDFPSRAELDAWLAKEPYMTGGVWKDIRIERCRIGPSFAA